MKESKSKNKNKKHEKDIKPFIVYDSTVLVISTGVSALNLREFRQALQNVDISSIYHHFWGRFLQPQFDEPEFNNDFASWVRHAIHDGVLAERLSVVNPSDFENLEDLRQELIDLVEERLDESELIEWTKADYQFNFLLSQMLVVDTGVKINHPREFPDALDEMSEGSIFYHFIDARRRTPESTNDFSLWLRNFGDKYKDLAENLEAIDPYFSSLKFVRKFIITIFQMHLDRKS